MRCLPLYFRSAAVGLAAFMMLSTTACAATPKGDSDAAFSIVFLANGKLEVRDANGEPVPAADTDKFFAENMGKLTLLRIRPAISLAEVKGSHYMLLVIGDKTYKVPLPHR